MLCYCTVKRFENAFIQITFTGVASSLSYFSHAIKGLGSPRCLDVPRPDTRNYKSVIVPYKKDTHKFSILLERLRHIECHVCTVVASFQRSLHFDILQ